MVERLPPELWLEVFTFLDARDLATVQRTCWTFCHYGGDERLWHSLCASECGGPAYLLALRQCMSPADASMSNAALYRRLRYAPFLRWDPKQPVEVLNHGLTAKQPTEGWTTTSTLEPLKPGRINYFEITFSKFGGSSFMIGVSGKDVLGAPEWCLERGDGVFYHCSRMIYAKMNGVSVEVETDGGFAMGTIGVYVDLGRGVITWLVNGAQRTSLYLDASFKKKELFPVVSWGGTRYCINLGVVPPLPEVNLKTIVQA